MLTILLLIFNLYANECSKTFGVNQTINTTKEAARALEQDLIEMEAKAQKMSWGQLNTQVASMVATLEVDVIKSIVQMKSGIILIPMGFEIMDKRGEKNLTYKHKDLFNEWSQNIWLYVVLSEYVKRYNKKLEV